MLLGGLPDLEVPTMGVTASAEGVHVDNFSLNPHELEVKIAQEYDIFRLPPDIEGVFNLRSEDRTHFEFVIPGCYLAGVVADH